MSLRVSALKKGELRPLARPGLLLFATRCAMRIDSWVPTGAEKLWHDGLIHCTQVAFDEPVPRNSIALIVRAASDCGAVAAHDSSADSAAYGSCQNYAMLTLAAAIEASAVMELAELKMMVIQAAKFSASIAAVLAHAGLVPTDQAKDPVEVASEAVWGAMRSDVPALACVVERIEAAQDRVRELRRVAELWPGGLPPWMRQP